MAVEAELKLALPPGEHDRVVHHPLLRRLASGPPREQVLHSTYYDTPELDLLRQGVALRVRRDGERWIQTLKGGGGVSGGLHRRSEWEWPLPGAEPDYSVINDPEAAGFLADPDLRGRIAPLFVTEFRRTRWDLAPPGGGRVELALDLGEVRSSHGSAPISELELELKSGAVPSLYEIGIALVRDLPLTIENRSKAQRGYAFHRPQPQPRRDSPTCRPTKRPSWPATTWTRCSSCARRWRDWSRSWACSSPSSRSTPACWRTSSGWSGAWRRCTTGSR
jgi:inorganic triphosphatase YgiF